MNLILAREEFSEYDCYYEDDCDEYWYYYYRQVEPYYKLAEENEEQEEMYYDDLVFRFLEKEEEVRSEVWSEECLLKAEETGMDSCMTYSNISTVPLDCLRLILKPFQRCEESFMISLVCRRWHSVIELNPKMNLIRQILHFAERLEYSNRGQFNILDWYRYLAFEFQ